MKVNISNQEIVNNCLKGEKEAFRLLYKKHSPWMMGICMRYCKNTDDAKDVLQEALVKIFNNIKDFKFNNDAMFISWIKRIVVNTAINFVRERAKNSFINIEETNYNLTVNDEYEEENLNTKYPAQLLLNLINDLPDGYRTVFNMYVFENMGHKDIAQELNISENTSKTQLYKARNYLKNKLLAATKKMTL